MKSPGNTKVTAFGEEDGACPLTREVLTRVGDKWTVLVVVLLGRGSRRFSELRRIVDGISQRMLTLTLRGLERDGLVVRTVFPTVPPRVQYELSPLGGTLLKTLTELAKWANHSRADIERARAEFDRREAAEAQRVERHLR